MISELRGYSLLRGARGAVPADVPALAQAVSTLSRVGSALADVVDSIEVNPFAVLPEGQGVLALDALVVPASPGQP